MLQLYYKFSDPLDFFPGMLYHISTPGNGYRSTERFLQEITDSTEYNRFYCGHWHTDKQDGKIRFLFHEIVLLDQ